MGSRHAAVARGSRPHHHFGSHHRAATIQLSLPALVSLFLTQNISWNCEKAKQTTDTYEVR
jgi:hypothetical protein